MPTWKRRCGTVVTALTVTTFSVAGDATVHAAGSTVSVSGVGAVTVNADGTYAFTPANNFNGTVPVVTYTVTDGFGGQTNGTVTIATPATATTAATARRATRRQLRKRACA